MASLMPLCQTTGHSIAKRPFDSLLKHTISYKLPSYAGLWCQSCRTNTCHSCIVSAQQSVGPQATQVPPLPRTAVPVVTTGNNTGWVRTFTESKPCNPDNLVGKNCETRTLESLVEHWIACVSALHMNILICCDYSRCCWFCDIFIVFAFEGGYRIRQCMLGTRDRPSWINLALACLCSIEVSFLLWLILWVSRRASHVSAEYFTLSFCSCFIRKKPISIDLGFAFHR